MQIVLSSSIVGNDANVINNIVKSIFNANNTDINSHEPQTSLFISNNTLDNSDFYIDAAKFLADNASFKMILLKNLANKIFGKYIDPRLILSSYNSIANEPSVTVTTLPVVSEPVALQHPVLKEIESIEDELKIINAQAFDPLDFIALHQTRNFSNS
jgi:hypothetical protein